MKAKRLIELFNIYSTVHPNRPEHSDQPVALLFAADEIKIDYRRGRVRLPQFGWQSCAEMVGYSGTIDWVAVCKEGDDWVLAFGEGSPFEASHVLPTENGYILAVPACLSFAALEDDFATL